MGDDGGGDDGLLAGAGSVRVERVRWPYLRRLSARSDSMRVSGGTSSVVRARAALPLVLPTSSSADGAPMLLLLLLCVGSAAPLLDTISARAPPPVAPVLAASIAFVDDEDARALVAYHYSHSDSNPLVAAVAVVVERAHDHVRRYPYCVAVASRPTTLATRTNRATHSECQYRQCQRQVFGAVLHSFVWLETKNKNKKKKKNVMQRKPGGVNDGMSRGDDGVLTPLALARLLGRL
jgi:hypothetical protein